MTKKTHEVTKLYIVRHGESESNVYAREHPDKPASHFGELGSSLTENGIKQAQKISLRLKKMPVSAVLSSDLKRAKETAEIIAREHNLPVITDETIRERFFGEHMSAVQKREIEKALDLLDEEGKFAFRYFEHGESGHDVVRRFKKFLSNVIEIYKNKTIVIVSHGYVMRSFLIHEKYAQYDELLGGSIINGGYFVAETEGKKYTITEKHGVSRRKGIDDEE
jgi:broad specificity phosphatase PhoE